MTVADCSRRLPPPTMPTQPLLAAIEAGGTKYVCAVAHKPDQPLREVRFPTTTPAETLQQATGFFNQAAAEIGPLSALGIGTFGPAAIDPDSPDYGHILTTPKPGWKGADILSPLRQSLGDSLPIAFDTDVNAAAIGEAKFGAARGHRHVAYITVGTGIGGGFLHHGRPIHGHMHTETGHLLVPDFDEPGQATSACPFHSNCLEGRASGPAIEKRWGTPARDLPHDHPAWALVARYLAAGAISLTATWSPDIILLGGGVMQMPGLIEKVRTAFADLAGDYWHLPPLDQYLQTPALDQQAGIIGALAMAAMAAPDRQLSP